MDLMTQLRLMVFGGWAILATLTLGTALALSWLLGRCERRQTSLREAVRQHLTANETRHPIGIAVRCGMLSPTATVTLDMRACSREEIWEIVTRLSRNLPSDVRLVVNGTGDRQLPATFTVTTSRSQLCRPSRPSVATG